MSKGQKAWGFPGIKLIEANTHGANYPDDPSYPYKMEAYYTPPRTAGIGFGMMFGSGYETLVIRARWLWALRWFVWRNGYRTHVRLKSFRITGPNGVIDEIDNSVRSKDADLLEGM